MTYREKMNIARWLYRKGPASEKKSQRSLCRKTHG